jgi:hypothetical protein
MNHFLQGTFTLFFQTAVRQTKDIVCIQVGGDGNFIVVTVRDTSVVVTVGDTTSLFVCVI